MLNEGPSNIRIRLIEPWNNPLQYLNWHWHIFDSGHEFGNREIQVVVKYGGG